VSLFSKVKDFLTPSATFTNPFLSVAGQKERLTNVVQTVKASVTSGFAPKAALVVATAAAPKLALSAAKEIVVGAGKVASNEFSKLGLVGKTVVAVGTPVAVSTLVTSQKAREGLVSLPSGLVNLGSNVGQFIDDPSVSNAVDIFKENPIIVGAGIAGAALAIGKGVVPALATIANTRAINESSELARESASFVPAMPSTPIYDSSDSPVSGVLPAEGAVAPMQAERVAVTTTARRRKAKPPKIIYRRARSKPQILNIQANQVLYGTRNR